jgi:SnoaL-like domain
MARNGQATETAKEGIPMGTEAGWTEKAKEDWANYRTAFEAYIPGGDTDTPEEIAKIRELRRIFMDYVEKTYAGMPDSTLMKEVLEYWNTIHWLCCSSSQDGNKCDAIEAVLKSRGYYICELYNRWYAEGAAKVKAVVAQCFVDDGVVRDEGGTFSGTDAIRDWSAAARKKYQHTVEPLSVIHRDGATIVAGRVAGDFPGSPVTLDHVFRLDGDKISSLEIR